VENKNTGCMSNRQRHGVQDYHMWEVHEVDMWGV